MSRILLIGLVVVFCVFSLIVRAAAPPNVVLIFCDDLGYGDIGCQGSKNPTPNIDRMAKEGVRFTDFYVAQAVCSASRAALLTGCYPNRIGIRGALPPRSEVGINATELTMAEMFKSRGYATGIFGKWHLGDRPEFNPTRHGFDEFFGLPYSNDMKPPKKSQPDYPELPLMDGEKVLERDPDQRKLTTLYTERAVTFIERNKDRPFFCYVPHSMPHVPLFVSEKFAGKSGRGLHGDVIAEVDWSVGQILDALQRQGIDRQTLVIFTSDNGPWLLFGDHGGSAGGLREGKGTTFEGGVRVPCVMRWPGAIPAGATCKELAATIDLLPTFAALAGATLPDDRIIDGKDLSPLLRGEPGATSPHEVFYYFWAQNLEAVRSGKWKLVFPHDYNHPDPPGGGGKAGKHVRRRIELSLYDLEADPGETKNLIADEPAVVTKLHRLAARGREDLGDTLSNKAGRNVRAPGRVPVSSATQPRAAPAGGP